MPARGQEIVAELREQGLTVSRGQDRRILMKPVSRLTQAQAQEIRANRASVGYALEAEEIGAATWDGPAELDPDGMMSRWLDRAPHTAAWLAKLAGTATPALLERADPPEEGA